MLLGDGLPASALVVEASKVPGLVALAGRVGLPPGAPAPLVAAAVDFVLEGLYAQKRIGRTDAGGYVGTEPTRRPATMRQAPAFARRRRGAGAGEEEAVLQLTLRDQRLGARARAVRRIAAGRIRGSVTR